LPPGAASRGTGFGGNAVFLLASEPDFSFLPAMPDWIAVILLGIVEGITEFLPVSSTGHLLITEKILQLCGALKPDDWLVAASAQKDLFNIVIQSGAVIAVLPLFSGRLKQFFFGWREAATQDYLLKAATAFVITGIGGFILDKKGFKLPEKLQPVAWALLAGGIGFLLIERWLRGKTPGTEITWAIVLAVGIGQLIAAVFPGASRSGTTILLSLLLGLSRPAATEFSFLVSIPTMLAAGGWKIFKQMHHHAADAPSPNWSLVLLGTVVASVVSFVAVKWLLRYVQTHTFNAFGWYRIAAAIGVFLLLLAH
jgi:undecaprenyl-diphosphatase